jgi:hypothetical protein
VLDLRLVSASSQLREPSLAGLPGQHLAATAHTDPPELEANDGCDEQEPEDAAMSAVTGVPMLAPRVRGSIFSSGMAPMPQSGVSAEVVT